MSTAETHEQVESVDTLPTQATSSADAVSREAFEEMKAQLVAHKKAMQEKEKELLQYTSRDTQFAQTLIPDVEQFVEANLQDAPKDWQVRMAPCRTFVDACRSGGRVSEQQLGIAMLMHTASAKLKKRTLEGDEATKHLKEQLTQTSQKNNDLEKENDDLRKKLRESREVERERYDTLTELAKQLEQKKTEMDCAIKSKMDMSSRNFSEASNREVDNRGAVSEGASAGTCSAPAMTAAESMAKHILMSSNATSRIMPRNGGSSHDAATAAALKAAAVM